MQVLYAGGKPSHITAEHILEVEGKLRETVYADLYNANQAKGIVPSKWEGRRSPLTETVSNTTSQRHHINHHVSMARGTPIQEGGSLLVILVDLLMASSTLPKNVEVLDAFYVETEEMPLDCAFLVGSACSGAAARLIASPTSRYSLDIM
jgi:hypothetical protein